MAPARDDSPIVNERLAQDVLRLWRQRLRRNPDDRPRTDDRGESERRLVSALLRVAEAETDESLAALAGAAANYGACQWKGRLDPGALSEELACLRDLVWERLKQSGMLANQAVDTILRFDRALSLVMTAAVTGCPRRHPTGGSSEQGTN